MKQLHKRLLKYLSRILVIDLPTAATAPHPSEKSNNQSLPLLYKVGDVGSEAIALTSICLVYSDLGHEQQTLRLIG